MRKIAKGMGRMLPSPIRGKYRKNLNNYVTTKLRITTRNKQQEENTKVLCDVTTQNKFICKVIQEASDALIKLQI